MTIARTDSVVPAAAAAGLMRQMGLATLESLMLALLPEAQALARPVISGFRVGAVGRDRASGDLLLGANVEFHGGTTADTIHAEQFLFSRAFHRGASLDLIAVSARPCGHCRQFMAEFEGRDYADISEAVLGLEPGGVLDPGGATRRLLGRIAPHARCDIVTWRRPPSS